MSCSFCDLMTQLQRSSHSRFVHEFKHSVLMVGEHQLFPGYCVLILKEHWRELHDLPEEIQAGYHSELIQAGRAISRAFAPWKMNYGSYGNQVPHLHWHLFPRYESDPKKSLVPWAQQDQFASHQTTDAQARAVIQAVRACLS